MRMHHAMMSVGTPSDTWKSAHHVTPWELSGVPVADDGDLLAVDRHMVVINDPAAIAPSLSHMQSHHQGPTTTLSAPQHCQHIDTSNQL